MSLLCQFRIFVILKCQFSFLKSFTYGALSDKDKEVEFPREEYRGFIKYCLLSFNADYMIHTSMIENLSCILGVTRCYEHKLYCAQIRSSLPILIEVICASHLK